MKSFLCFFFWGGGVLSSNAFTILVLHTDLKAAEGN